MRIRRLLLALCIGILPVFVIAAPSGASENEVPACIAELAEKYELVGPEGIDEVGIEEAKHKSDAFKVALDKCNQSPSPVMPAIPELLWGGLAFAIVFFGLAKVGFPAIKKGLAAREEKIRSDSPVLKVHARAPKRNSPNTVHNLPTLAKRPLASWTRLGHRLTRFARNSWRRQKLTLRSCVAKPPRTSVSQANER